MHTHRHTLTDSNFLYKSTSKIKCINTFYMKKFTFDPCVVTAADEIAQIINLKGALVFLNSSEEFMKHKNGVAKQTVNSRSGRPIPVKDIEQYQQLEQKKDHEVMLVRQE